MKHFNLKIVISIIIVMPSKSINHSILKRFDSRNHRVPTKYYQPMLEKELLQNDKVGRGIRINDLIDFNAGGEVSKIIRPIDKVISEVNDKFQPFADKVHQEVSKAHFIFGQSEHRLDAKEITQN